MSIYSGFATRFQEESYDHCIDSLLYILQKRMIRFYSGEPAEEDKFIAVVMKLNQQMKKMEKSKYLEPKSSESVSELVKFMQVYQGNIIAGNKVEMQPSLEQQTVAVQVEEQVEDKPEKKKSLYWV